LSGSAVGLGESLQKWGVHCLSSTRLWGWRVRAPSSFGSTPLRSG
jgi:hypothetical protein